MGGPKLKLAFCNVREGGEEGEGKGCRGAARVSRWVLVGSRLRHTSHHTHTTHYSRHRQRQIQKEGAWEREGEADG